ncbi:hypothetical protein [Paenarthrobacter nitroguajacolicus]
MATIETGTTEQFEELVGLDQIAQKDTRRRQNSGNGLSPVRSE